MRFPPGSFVLARTLLGWMSRRKGADATTRYSGGQLRRGVMGATRASCFDRTGPLLLRARSAIGKAMKAGGRRAEVQAGGQAGSASQVYPTRAYGAVLGDLSCASVG